MVRRLQNKSSGSLPTQLGSPQTFPFSFLISGGVPRLEAYRRMGPNGRRRKSMPDHAQPRMPSVPHGVLIWLFPWPPVVNRNDPLVALMTTLPVDLLGS